MYGDNIIQEYKHFETNDKLKYAHYQGYIRQYLTAEMN